MVEAQHTASIMKIVDSTEELHLLETLLEGSKPAQPANALELDYFLATPFRYFPLGGGSRFRAIIDRGVFYGAESVRTAALELSYCRWKFLIDAVDLVRLEPVAHTAFSVDVCTKVVDLRSAPFDAKAATWQHTSDYIATQAFAQVVRDAQFGAIKYKSVRDPNPAWCIAVLTPQAFAKRTPNPLMQTWWLAVHQDAVNWRRDKESMSFSFEGWLPPSLEKPNT